MTTELPKLRKVNEWRGQHEGFAFRISQHNVGEAYPNHGRGSFCCYIYIREGQVPAPLFEQIWLEDKPVKFSETSPERITHEYYGNWVAELDWHGGVTYYEKHCTAPGHRCVEFGADYSHLYDDETIWDEQIVLFDVVRTINQIKEYVTNFKP